MCKTRVLADDDHSGSFVATFDLDIPSRFPIPYLVRRHSLQTKAIPSDLHLRLSKSTRRVLIKSASAVARPAMPASQATA